MKKAESNMKDLISIAFTCDEKYVKHVGVVIQSIFTNAAAEDRHEFHIVARGNLTKKSEERLYEVVAKGKAKLFIHQIDINLVAGMPEIHYYPLEVYFRIFLPQILRDCEKVLYLDSDIIVLVSLQELWDINIEEYALAATSDISTIFGGQDYSNTLKTLQLPEEYVYFNSGVLLLNLKMMREMQLPKKTQEWILSNKDLIWCPDQDALNVMMADKYKYIHLRWNLQVTLITLFEYGKRYNQEQIEAVASPAILHYISERKPWRREFKLPYKNLYFQYLVQTPWKEEPLEPITIYKVWRRLLAELSWIYRRWILRYWLLSKKIE